MTCEHPAGIPAAGSASSLELRVDVAADAMRYGEVLVVDDTAEALSGSGDGPDVERLGVRDPDQRRPSGLREGLGHADAVVGHPEHEVVPLPRRRQDDAERPVAALGQRVLAGDSSALAGRDELRGDAGNDRCPDRTAVKKSC